MSLITENLMWDLIGLLVALVAVLITFFKVRFSFFKNLGVEYLNPIFPFGDAKPFMLRNKSLGEFMKDCYFALKAKGRKHGGVFIGPKPFYVPLDPELIKNIMQKDFLNFTSHGSYVNEKDDPLSATLFSLDGEKWKHMRVKLTPTFTSGKMKMMFDTIANSSVGLKHLMDESVNSRTPVDIKEVLGRFTTDVIGNVAFGIECNSLKDPNAPFRHYGKKVFELSIFKVLCQLTFPHSFLKAVGFKVTKSDVERFFMKAVKDAVDYREKNNISRKDFLHLLIQLKNLGKVTDDEKIVKEKTDAVQKDNDSNYALTLNELSAQAFVFFLAGFETSSTTTTFALYELCENQEVQEKLRKEINTVLAKHDGQMTYAAMMEMHYMDQVIDETLRKYPPVPFLPRQCTQDYKVPGTDVVIKKGMSVTIPVLGIQYDPEYYPNPNKFDPDRFSAENKKTRVPFTWLPFGDGPRVCIGLRFGVLQTKVALTAIVQNYRLTRNDKTLVPISFDVNSFILSIHGGVWLNVEKI